LSTKTVNQSRIALSEISREYNQEQQTVTAQKELYAWNILFATEGGLGRSAPAGKLQKNRAGCTFSAGRGDSKRNLRLQAASRRIGMGFLAWIVVGLIAGWLAGQVMKGGGYGILVDIILGILGGILGGWVFGLLGIWPGGGILGAIIVSFVGAVILVAITRLLKRA
jgi:uncharacterized membrane protein YeaQ/YmgE (transglycosylase-associated protein family)